MVYSSLVWNAEAALGQEAYLRYVIPNHQRTHNFAT